MLVKHVHKPLAITRLGETLGFNIPTQERNRKAKLEAMGAAAKDLDEMIASWGAAKDALMAEYKEIRQAARAKRPECPVDLLSRRKHPGASRACFFVL